MRKSSLHLSTIRNVTPSERGCEECLKTGSVWVHLRICRTCGHVGCCDQSPGRHATAHYHATVRLDGTRLEVIAKHKKALSPPGNPALHQYQEKSW
jgi:hypothetical protein